MKRIFDMQVFKGNMIYYGGISAVFYKRLIELHFSSRIKSRYTVAGYYLGMLMEIYIVQARLESYKRYVSYLLHDRFKGFHLLGTIIIRLENDEEIDGNDF